MPSRKAAVSAVLWSIYLLSYVTEISCTGAFELELRSFRNEHGLNMYGNCCNGIRTGGTCSSTCHTFFRICLAHYMEKIGSNPDCTYNSHTTPVVGNNTIDFTQKDYLPVDYQNPIRLQFTFKWPRTFSIIIEAWHDATFNGPSPGSTREQIARLATQGSVDVGPEWKQLNYSSRYTNLEYRYRVTCDEHYYGDGCAQMCRPRDDKFGHYRCDKNGDKVCLDGWTGDYCEQAMCLPNCHQSYGFCDVPNECKCIMGWQGPYCNQCIPYPGCQHGSCSKPWDCNCQEGWGGLFCNQDLNFCTHHKPCKNRGTCTNTGQGSYTCTCIQGFNGTNCEVEIDDCERQPCSNGGTCEDIGSGYRCRCLEGYYGRRCGNIANSCENNPCGSAGTCHEREGTYACECNPGYTGLNCEIDINECTSRPCKNGGRCIDQLNGFRCVCYPGFSGPTCEENEDNCSHKPCFNGGVCEDGLNDFKCRCVPGFVGPLCQDNVDDCEMRPCANGGSCLDRVNDFSCSCAPGFMGKDCRIKINMCASDPCRHGGKCIDHLAEYSCECAVGFWGKNCQFYEGMTSPTDVTTEATRVTGNGEGGIITTTEEAGAGNHSGIFQPESESGLSKSELLMVVVLGAGIPLVLIIIVMIVCLCRRRNHNNKENNMEKENQQNIVNNINNKIVESSSSNIIPTISQSSSNSSSIKISNEEKDFSMKHSKQTILEISSSKQFVKDLNTNEHSQPYYPKTDYDFGKPPKRLDLHSSPVESNGSISDYSPRDIQEVIVKPSYMETNRNSILVLDPTNHRHSHVEEVFATEV
ncbi:delta-like protein 1 [Gigantopelta aegis]|uniref:delta-like protein 1 n=1 Tax=Gigantopelta aegis TaxID=1735272 RepID=UPI001B88DF22|nr:delta-like protein 1 [Gigantopelta aegis]XP_041352375.1 delta-like protein 1 [Gigantopelta aegis]XP_041352376.1 delta-like protein 1 [Gigantopelta aegis]